MKTIADEQDAIKRSSIKLMTANSVSEQSTRLTSLDAFRGAVMLLMASSGLGLAKIAASKPDNHVWQFIGRQVEHARWAGCTLWDLIQPAFMFMVGAALAWSIAKRQQHGQTHTKLWWRTLWRSAVLIALAVFLTSAWSNQTEWSFNNVLAQIGLGYAFLVLLAVASTRTQLVSAVTILLVYWLLFAIWPLLGPKTDWAQFNVPATWEHLDGFAQHWDLNTNFASAFDRWFLNLFPREEPYIGTTGGYHTLNFVPSIVTMLFGFWFGAALQKNGHGNQVVLRIGGFATMGIVAGILLHVLGICPIVKRIWTPSWTLFSGGVVAWLLVIFYLLVDGLGWRRWAFPLVVAGMNPITLYCMWQLSQNFIKANIRIHFGQRVFDVLGFGHTVVGERVICLLVMWLVLLWMYRQKIFIRI